MAGPPVVTLRGSQVMWPCCASISEMTGLSRMTSRLASLNPLGRTNSSPPSTAVTGRYMPAGQWKVFATETEPLAIGAVAGLSVCVTLYSDGDLRSGSGTAARRSLS